MRIFVESLKRLYSQGKITLEKLQEMLDDKKIDQTEFDYIIGA